MRYQGPPPHTAERAGAREGVSARERDKKERGEEGEIKLSQLVQNCRMCKRIISLHGTPSERCRCTLLRMRAHADTPMHARLHSSGFSLETFSSHHLTIWHKVRFAHHKCRSSALSPVVPNLKVHRDHFLRHAARTGSLHRVHVPLRARQHTGHRKDLARGSEVVSALVAYRIDVFAVVVAIYIKEYLREPGMHGGETGIKGHMDGAEQVAAGMRCVEFTTALCRTRQHECGLANGTGVQGWRLGTQETRAHALGRACKQENEEATQAPVRVKHVSGSAHSQSQARRG
jgi:hypothetical protein